MDACCTSYLIHQPTQNQHDRQTNVNNMHHVINASEFILDIITHEFSPCSVHRLSGIWCGLSDCQLFIRCDDNKVARKKMRFNVVPTELKGAPGFDTSYSVAEHYVINSDTLTMPLCQPFL